MYICVCKSLTDRDIRREVLRGEVRCMASLRERLGASTGCGCCESAARECLEEALVHKRRCHDAARGASAAPEAAACRLPGPVDTSFA